MPSRRATSAYANYNPTEDDLLQAARAVQALDALDSMARRDQQTAMEAKQMEMREREMGMRLKEIELDQQRVGLGLAEAQRKQDQDRLDIWNKTRAETAASHAALGVPKIDLDSPDGETQLGNWMSYAKSHGVPESSIQTIFEPRVRELAVKKEYNARAQAEALGADGLRLYNALRTFPGSDGKPMSPEEASGLATKSKGAQKALADAQAYAQEKGIPFTLSTEDWKKIKKKIGTNISVSSPTGVIPAGPNSVNATAEPEYTTFDPRPIYYDMDGVNEVLHAKLSTKYDQLAKDQAEAQQTWLASQQANTKQSLAAADKAATEAAVLRYQKLDHLQNQQAVPQKTPQANGQNPPPPPPNNAFKAFSGSPTPTPTPSGP